MSEEDKAIQWHERHRPYWGNCWVCCERCNPEDEHFPNPHYSKALEEVGIREERCDLGQRRK